MPWPAMAFIRSGLFGGVAGGTREDLVLSATSEITSITRRLKSSGFGTTVCPLAFCVLGSVMIRSAFSW